MRTLFKISRYKDLLIEESFDAAMKELGEFYEISWIRNLPRVFILDSRRDIDDVYGKGTERWLVGWGERERTIYLLDRKNFKNESTHLYNDKRYCQLLKHELSHLFYAVKTKSVTPRWLNEGLAIYVSGQTGARKKLKAFKSFLECFDECGEMVYEEAGPAVKLLIDYFGKDKLIEFLKSIRDVKDTAKVSANFYDNFKIELTYANFNKLLEKRGS